MNNIKVGEYIRTKNGYIGKIVDIVCGQDAYFDNREMFLGFNMGAIMYSMNGIDIYSITFEENVKKHSFNIIDLTEEGDFVKLEYYVAKYKKRITRIFEISKIDGWQFVGFENEHCHFTYDLEKNRWLDGKGYNPKIKSIVTKEQMKTKEYEVS